MEGNVAWTVIGVGLVLAGLILVTTRSTRGEIRVQADRLDKRIDEISKRLGRLEEGQARLRAEMQALTERVSGLEEGQGAACGAGESVGGESGAPSR